jgi:putative membrane protein insertion efficiency factor
MGACELIVRRILTGVIRGYKLVLSPFMGQNCRFHPGCANYAIEAIETHGALRGGWLACSRILRCHPLHPGGFDPVPGSPDTSRQEALPGNGEQSQTGRVARKQRLTATN